MIKSLIKYCFLLMCSCFFLGTVFAEEKSFREKTENCTNYVLIQGSSNINSFEFIHDDPRLLNPVKSNEQFTWSQDVIVPVHEFTGSNERMRKDFLELLKASEYPVIQIEIEPKNRKQIITPDKETTFMATVTLAGNKHNYVVSCTVVSCDSPEALLEGSVQVKLSDFNIEPPKKVMGAIKVNDEVFIKFAFKHEFDN